MGRLQKYYSMRCIQGYHKGPMNALGVSDFSWFRLFIGSSGPLVGGSIE